MRRTMYGIMLGAALLILAPAGSSYAGTLTATVHAYGKAAGTDAVVYIGAITGKTFPAPKKPVVMNQEHMKFVPHVMPVLVGTTVKFLNDDDVLHNVFSPEKSIGKFNLGTWAKGQSRSHTFKKLGSGPLLCSVHPDMEAFMVVLPTPYFAQTHINNLLKSGSLKIDDIPAGTYTVKVWSEKKWKAAPQKVTIPAKGEVHVDFSLKP